MFDMPRTRLPYLSRERTRHGAMVWYFRRGKGARIRLPDDYGSAAFTEAYNQALNGQKPATDRRMGSKGTVEWLIRQWMASGKWQDAMPSTQKQRRLTLQKISEKGGSIPISNLTTAMLQRGLDERRDTPAAANWYLKVIKALFKWAVEYGHMDHNPAQGIKGLKNKTPGFIPWTDDDVSTFRNHWPIGTKQRLAFELLATTGLRRGDIVRIGPQHIANDLLTIETEKTGTEANCHMDEWIYSVIDASPSGHMLYLVTEHGKAYSKEGFANWFRRACVAAGVKGSPHGVRKWAAAKDAERGASEMQLRAKYAWESPEQSSTYTKSADRKRLARSLALGPNDEHNSPHLDAGAGNILKR